MSKQNYSAVFALGLATFAMLFGAGNVFLPLALGRAVGDKVFYAILGFAITAIIVPLLGLVAVILFEGDYKKFLGTLGRVPGSVVALFCMILIGPFGAIPRCLTLAHAAVQWHVKSLSLFVFSFIALIIVFFLSLSKGRAVEILGKYLGPIKLTLLLSVVALGLISPFALEPTSFTPLKSFLAGFNDGPLTLDLLGTIFFSSLIYSSLKRIMTQNNEVSTKHLIKTGLQVCIIGGSLLGIVYSGFCLLAAMYGTHIYGVERAQILSALTTYILGSWAGILANITVAVACLTTAIALTTVFADYIFHEVFRGRFGYQYALLITSVIAFSMANLGLDGIMGAIEPAVFVCYPALIALCIVNIANKLFGFKYIKTVVFLTLLSSLIFKYGTVLFGSLV